uniref:Coproporphyrinogen oxidase n=1 Tax=Eucampia antarctica TaxID=49252 RepID=A0A7S2S7X3_9STRA|mmetsp:Transcript_4284/g.4065  ORF Transcript_4284/g.4065 Transcript_4284/m.4065 type:complete len:230 (+) Transcript_4284:517-1206(+)
MQSSGITRVFQKGTVIEKGACSFTLLRGGKLTADRSAAIQRRHQEQLGEGGNDVSSIREGDEYAAATLSIVLHSRSPTVPTFRSDVRIFVVRPSNNSKNGDVLSWFGEGAGLTPYYLFDEDISFFHGMYRDLCDTHGGGGDGDHDGSSSSSIPINIIDYRTMKQSCDDYFYLPARAKHRGTGGIFFVNLPATPQNLTFLKGVTSTWMPSWLPIVTKRQRTTYTTQQREW